MGALRAMWRPRPRLKPRLEAPAGAAKSACADWGVLNPRRRVSRRAARARSCGFNRGRVDRRRDIARALGLVCLALGVTLLAACGNNMRAQPRYEPLDQSSFFANGQSARPIPPDTVARGQLQTDQARYTGMVNGTPVATLPVPLTRQLLQRGQERFDIYCAPCHGQAGDGQGMIVQRGFPAPPSFHTDRLRAAPIGHFYDVITNGYGVMYSYADRVSPDDRWAIAAYIRALQLSQHANIDDLTPAERSKLEGK